MLDGVGGQGHAPADWSYEKESVPIAQESVLFPVSIWTRAENIAPTGIRSEDPSLYSKSLYWLLYPDTPKLEDIKQDRQCKYNIT